MTPAYDLSLPEDRLRLALSFPTREHRIAFLWRIREQFGEEAADELIRGLKDHALKNRAANNQK